MMNSKKQEHKDHDADITHQRILALRNWLKKLPKDKRGSIKNIIRNLKAGISN